MHVISQEGRPQGPVEWETDRGRFLGRGRGPDDPQALDGRPLSGTTGALLDPMVSLRQRLRLAPGAVARLCFSTGVATSRETALALAQRYHDPSRRHAHLALAFAHAQSALRHLGITSDEALLFERLASRVLYADASLRAPGTCWRRTRSARRGCGATASRATCPSCWCASSGDDLALARAVLQAQEYWRLKGLVADVVC